MKFMQIEPQPARGTLREEMWDSPDWIAEEKYDGDRRIAQFCGKIVRFTGRRKSVKDGLFVEKTENVPHLSGGRVLQKITPIHVPPPALEGTVLDGEMIVDPDDSAVPSLEGKSKFVTSIMGSLPEEAVRKQIERGWLRYVVFDCLFYKGKDVRRHSLEERQDMATAAVRTWGNPFAAMAEQVIGEGREMYERVIARGGEGVILKHVNHRYGDKNLWVKVKKVATYDVVIIGFKAAKETSKKVNGEVSRTKYAGKVGSVEIGQYAPVGGLKVPGFALRDGQAQFPDIIHVGFARGFSDRLMDEFTRHPKKYLNKVITIEANGREPTLMFRHPRVIDAENPFRTDKAAKDCVYREDES